MSDPLDLFPEPRKTQKAPLPERMRPRTLDEVVGQDHLAGPDGILRHVGLSPLPSLLLHGPPGSGKTTLARLYAENCDALFLQISAVLSGVGELRQVVERARAAQQSAGKPAILFVDEIHRWNKAQQDALLPHVEAGTVALVGATTENPSFQIIAPLRSRCRVVRLQRLEQAHVATLIRRALADEERGLALRQLVFSEEAIEALARAADGDARRGLVLLEDAARPLPDGTSVDGDRLASLLNRQDLLHDRGGDAHYDVLSAFIKSMRGSDPDAALYWLARLLEGGEPPEAIARRIVILAAEDVGNADPRALSLAVAAAGGVAMVGMPEARILLAQATTYCAAAPKSNASYMGLERAAQRVRATGALPVPMHLRNAPTPEMKAEGMGQGYLYPHDFPGSVVEQEYRPPEVATDTYYEPVSHGAEKTIGERLLFWRQQLRRRRN